MSDDYIDEENEWPSIEEIYGDDDYDSAKESALDDYLKQEEKGD